MRVLIDLSGLLTDSYYRGIGRFTEEFAKAFALSDNELSCQILLNGSLTAHLPSIKRKFRSLLGADQLEFWSGLKSIDEVGSNSSLSQSNARLLEAKINELSPDVFIVTEHFTKGYDFSRLRLGNTLLVVFVYDLIPVLFKSDYFIEESTEKWFMGRVDSLKSADLLLTISDSSKQDIVEHTGHANVVNVGCATSARFRYELAMLSENSERPVTLPKQDFMFYSGGYDKRKSVPMMISAFTQFTDQSELDYGLVLAGEMPDGVRVALEHQIKRAGLDGKVIILGHISDQLLIQCYRHCSIYLHVSAYEGFGLPLLEAMTCGAAIIAANNSSVPEVVAGCAELFETNNVESLVSAMLKLAGNTAILDFFKVKGPTRATRFGWDSVVIKTSQAIHASVSAKQQVDSSSSGIVGRDQLLECLRGNGHDQSERRQLASAIAYTFDSSSRNQQLLIDISILVIVDSKSGIQRVVKSILAGWIDHPPKGFVVVPVYLCPISAQFKNAVVSRSTEGAYRYSQSDGEYASEFNLGDIFVGLDLNHDLVVNKRKAYQELIASKAMIYFVLYDLLPVKYPQFFAHSMDELHHKWLSGIARSDGVIAISGSVLDDYKAFVNDSDFISPAPDFRYEYFPLGCDILATNGTGVSDPDSDFIQRVANKLNILVVGTIEPRKGHAQLIEGFYDLFDSNDDVNLWVVGREGWKMGEVVEQLSQGKYANSRLFWFDGIDDKSLEALYQNANGYIAASFDEGFGLPIIEAAQKGLPVFARDIPVFREVAGSGATFFSGSSRHQFAKELADWVHQLREGTAKPSDQIQYIDWAESAQRLSQIINRISKYSGTKQ